MNQTFRQGLRDGFPICLGYFFVSFGFGIYAVQNGLPALAATIISLTNLTSAGQVAGVAVIAAAGTFLEIIMTQLIINIRYSLMGLALSQNLSEEFTWYHRMLVSFGITDEIFGVAASRKTPLRPVYMYGMILIASVGWVGGTLLGALSGELFPERLTSAFGILLYGMFIAIIVPPVREAKANLILILIAAAISCVITYGMPFISGGFSIIISAVIAAVIMSIAVPVDQENEEEEK